MTGEAGDHTFCEFFFDNAETPVTWQVGERGQGWYVSRTTLKHERASIGGADGLGKQFAKLVELAKRSEEHTSELQSLMRISYAVFYLKKKKKTSAHPNAISQKPVQTKLYIQLKHKKLPLVQNR